jgi:hypothetical protein
MLALLGLRYITSATQDFGAVIVEKLAGQHELSSGITVIDTPACGTQRALEGERLALGPGPPAILVPDAALRAARRFAELLAGAIRIMDLFTQKRIAALLATNWVR